MFASWGWGEWLIVLVIVVIIFGVGRLPEVGGALGKAIREFRSQTEADSEEEGIEDVSEES
jgi:sec-independent protein translocase protein TatA